MSVRERPTITPPQQPSLGPPPDPRAALWRKRLSWLAALAVETVRLGGWLTGALCALIGLLLSWLIAGWTGMSGFMGQQALALSLALGMGWMGTVCVGYASEPLAQLLWHCAEGQPAAAAWRRRSARLPAQLNRAMAWVLLGLTGFTACCLLVGVAQARQLSAFDIAAEGFAWFSCAASFWGARGRARRLGNQARALTEPAVPPLEPRRNGKGP
jgi:hypothetical protein